MLLERSFPSPPRDALRHLPRPGVSSATSSVMRALAAFGTLVLPTSCVRCGAWDTSLCPPCLRLFRRSTVRPFRAESGAESLPDVPRPEGETDWGADGYGPLPVLAAGRYRNAVPAVVLAFKDHGHVDLVPPVSAALAGALHEAVAAFGRPGGRPVLLVPVPSRGASRRKRGYDPLMLVLTSLHRGGRLPAGTVLAPAVRHVPPVLRLVAGGPSPGCAAASVLAPVRDGFRHAFRHGLREGLRDGLRGGQKGLGRRRRRSRVSGSMAPAAGWEVAGRHCIVVDDVLTTGATVGEVHRVLTSAGACVLGAVVIAATAPPAGDLGTP